MLIAGTDIRNGLFGRKRQVVVMFLGEYIPEPVMKYAKSVAETTGLPLEEVLKSQPVRNYMKKFYQ